MALLFFTFQSGHILMKELTDLCNFATLFTFQSGHILMAVFHTKPHK